MDNELIEVVLKLFGRDGLMVVEVKRVKTFSSSTDSIHQGKVRSLKQGSKPHIMCKPHSVTLPVKMFGPFWSVWCKMALAEVCVSLP